MQSRNTAESNRQVPVLRELHVGRGKDSRSFNKIILSDDRYMENKIRRKDRQKYGKRDLLQLK